MNPIPSNPGEWNQIITLFVTLITPYAAKVGIGANDLTSLLVALIPVAWGIYSHWNMKKVPETAVVAGGNK